MNDQDDFNDFDGDIVPDNGGDEGERDPKNALKEAWDNNPLLKVGAVVLGLAVLYAGYALAFKSEAEVVNKSSVTAGNIKETKVVPGAEVGDEVWNDAVKDKNQQEAEAAKETGGSAIPIPIAPSREEGINLPEVQSSGSEDPLAAWRARKEQAQAQQAVEPDPLPEIPPMAQPDIVPMTQPQKPVQQAAKIDANTIKSLAQQMRAILVAQVPPDGQKKMITQVTEPYAKLQEQAAIEEAKLRDQQINGLSNGYGVVNASASGVTVDGMAANATNGLTSTQAALAKKKVIVPAGNIAYAQLMNQLNSDIEGPALAQVMSGPFTGGRAIGAFEMKGEFLVISFKRIIKDGVAYTINGIALNENTTLAAHQSDVDSHYFSRIVLPAAAKFVEGYAGALAETGTQTTVTPGGGAVQSDEAPSPKESLYKGVEEAGNKISESLEQNADRPITVTVNKGTTMGILFMDSVTTESVDQ